MGKGPLYPGIVDAVGKTLEIDSLHGSQTCLDGILVAGEPQYYGENINRPMGNWYANPIELGRAYFILDIRGQIKPPLTPTRAPPDNIRYRPHSRGPRWDRIQMLANRAYGRLWEKIADQLGNGLDDETFWQLSIIYGLPNANTYLMRAKAIWSQVSVPILYEDGRHEWKPIASLNALKPKKIQKEGFSYLFQLSCEDGGYVGVYDALTKWFSNTRNNKESIEWDLNTTVACMSTVVLGDDNVHLELRTPPQPDTSPKEFILVNFMYTLNLLPYSDKAQEFLSIHMPVRSVNRDHPLAQLAKEAQYLESPSEIQKFASSAVWFLSDPTTDILKFVGDPNSAAGVWRRQIGSLYMDVDWQNIERQYHPPYNIRVSNGETVRVNAEDFEHLAGVSK
jgi:hypothetical protein